MSSSRNHTCFYLFRCAVALLLAAALGGTTTLSAAETLTLEDCWRAAESYSVPLKAQAERQAQARERLAQSRGGLLPRADADYLVSRREAGSGGGEGSQLALSAAQTLYEGGRLRAAVDVSSSQLRREELATELVRRDVRRGVAAAFYSLAQTESDMKNVAETVSLMNGRLRELRERVRLGKSRESETLATESQIAALRAQEEGLKGDGANARESLSTLTGLPPSAIVIRDTVPLNETPGPVDPYVAGALEGPAARIARQDVATQESRLGLVRGALRPTAGVTGAWYPSRTGTLDGASWDVRLTLNQPLYRGGILRSRVSEEESFLRETKVQESGVRRDVAEAVRTRYNDLAAAIARKKALEEAFDRSKRSYTLQQRDYRLGLVNNLDVLAALNSMLDAKKNLDRAALQVKLSRILLDITAEPVK